MHRIHAKFFRAFLTFTLLAAIGSVSAEAATKPSLWHRLTHPFQSSTAAAKKTKANKKAAESKLRKKASSPSWWSNPFTG
jgi:hypothetical protein